MNFELPLVFHKIFMDMKKLCAFSGQFLQILKLST